MVIRTIGHRTHTVTGEESTLSETIRQRPIGAGCWRFLHANDDKVSACGFRNDVRSRHVLFRPAVWLFREFSVRIINMNGHLCMIDFRSQPEPIFIPFKQLLPNRFPFTRSEVAWPVILAHVGLPDFFRIRWVCGRHHLLHAGAEIRQSNRGECDPEYPAGHFNHWRVSAFW